MGHVVATLQTRSFRFINDDGSESSATFRAAANTNISELVGNVFRLRFEIQETTGGSTSNSTHLIQWSKNGGSWTNLGTSGDVVAATSAFGVGGTLTTNRLTAGSGTFRTGEINFAGDIDSRSSYSGNDHSEHEWVLQINNGVPGDTFSFRVLVDSTVITSAVGDPTVTVASPQVTAAPTLSGTTVSTTSLGTSWTAVANATNYELEILRPEVGTWQAVITQTTRTRTVSGLTPYTTYSFRVRGINSNGQGPWSNTLVRTTNAPLPSAPTLITPEPDATIAFPLTLEWQHNESAGSPQTEYRLIRRRWVSNG